MNDVMFLRNRAKIKHDVMFRRVHQVAALGGNISSYIIIIIII